MKLELGDNWYFPPFKTILPTKILATSIVRDSVPCFNQALQLITSSRTKKLFVSDNISHYNSWRKAQMK